MSVAAGRWLAQRTACPPLPLRYQTPGGLTRRRQRRFFFRTDGSSRSRTATPNSRGEIGLPLEYGLDGLVPNPGGARRETSRYRAIPEALLIFGLSPASDMECRHQF